MFLAKKAKTNKKMRAERITTSVTTVISPKKTQNIFKQIEAIAPKS
jgi:hypothetical protein